MADLDKRTKEEKNLTLAIMLLLASMEDDMLSGYLGADAFYSRIAESSIPALASRVYQNSGQSMVRELGLGSDAQLSRYMREQSMKYPFSLAQRMSENQNKWYSDLQKADSGLELGLDGKPKASSKDVPYSKYDAAREAVTSISAMNSDSQQATKKYLQDFKNVKTTFVWIPERDSSTCPVCRALGGQYEEQWSLQFPKGPPAHPNCRCYLSAIRVYAS